MLRWGLAHARCPVDLCLYPHGRLPLPGRAAPSALILGVVWGDVERGVAELNGIDHRTVRDFSPRRVQIEAAAGPEASMAQRRSAALPTRPAKPSDSFESLMADWRERASDLCVNVDSVTTTPLLRPQQPRSSRVQALTVAVDSERGKDQIFDSDMLDRDLCEKQAR